MGRTRKLPPPKSKKTTRNVKSQKETPRRDGRRGKENNATSDPMQVDTTFKPTQLFGDLKTSGAATAASSSSTNTGGATTNLPARASNTFGAAPTSAPAAKSTGIIIPAPSGSGFTYTKVSASPSSMAPSAASGAGTASVNTSAASAGGLSSTNTAVSLSEEDIRGMSKEELCKELSETANVLVTGGDGLSTTLGECLNLERLVNECRFECRRFDTMKERAVAGYNKNFVKHKAAVTRAEESKKALRPVFEKGQRLKNECLRRGLNFTVQFPDPDGVDAPNRCVVTDEAEELQSLSDYNTRLKWLALEMEGLRKQLEQKKIAKMIMQIGDSMGAAWISAKKKEQEAAYDMAIDIFRKLSKLLNDTAVDDICRIIGVFDASHVDVMAPAQIKQALRLLSRGGFNLHQDFINRVLHGLENNDRKLLDCLEDGDLVPRLTPIENLDVLQIKKAFGSPKQLEEAKETLRTVLFYFPAQEAAATATSAV